MAKTKKYSSGGPVPQHHTLATTGGLESAPTGKEPRYAKGGRVGAGKKKGRGC